MPSEGSNMLTTARHTTGKGHTDASLTSWGNCKHVQNRLT
jgi:hypothetical protein